MYAEAGAVESPAKQRKVEDTAARACLSFSSKRSYCVGNDWNASTMELAGRGAALT